MHAGPKIRTSFIILFVAILLSGCAAQHYKMSNQHSMPELQAEHFITSDATHLPLQVWEPTTSPQAQLVLLHGFNEYSGAFERVGRHFAQHGVKVWAYDQRGFGRTEQAGLWAGGDVMAQDSREFIQLVAAHNPSIPLFLLGVSMGGAVALRATAQQSVGVFYRTGHQPARV